MVKIKTYIDSLLNSEEVITNSFIEFYFVKNAISYVAKNKDDKNNALDLYNRYVKLIALNKSNLSSDNVVMKLDVWFKKTFSNDLKKEICIVCNNEEVRISI